MGKHLHLHYAPILHQTVEGSNGPTRFSILPGPAYRPKYGPIEYESYELIQHIFLSRQSQISLDEFEQEIISAAARIGLFDSTFYYCRYIIYGNYS